MKHEATIPCLTVLQGLYVPSSTLFSMKYWQEKSVMGVKTPASSILYFNDICLDFPVQ